MGFRVPNNFFQRNSMDYEKRIYLVVGKRIRQARIKADMTQEMLSMKVGLGRTSITNIEDGQQKIQLHTLFAIADALNLTAQELITDIEIQDRSYDELLDGRSIISEHGEEDLDQSERERIVNLLSSENE